jgi:hypothetical protein
VFIASLGDNLGPVLMTIRGNVLIFGSLTFAVLIPLLMHGRFGQRHTWAMPAAAFCALFGGLLLRYGAVTTAGELLRRGPAVAEHRHTGQPVADSSNRRVTAQKAE